MERVEYGPMLRAAKNSTRQKIIASYIRTYRTVSDISGALIISGYLKHDIDASMKSNPKCLGSEFGHIPSGSDRLRSKQIPYQISE